MRLFVIQDQNGNILKTTHRKSSWFYLTLGLAKTASKNFIKYQNSKKNKPDRQHFEDFEIVEYELVEKVRHKL